MIRAFNYCYFSALLAFFFFIPYASAKDAGLQNQPNGTYITNEGWGILKLSNDKTQKDVEAKSFEINTVGTNGHFCELRGTILSTGIAQLKDANNDQKLCTIHFKPNETGINILEDEKSDSCRSFCGSRASFASHYNAIQPICEPYNIRNAFGAYESSRATDELDIAKERIQPILKDCAKTISLEEKAKLHQALALINYHTHNLAKCQETLAPYQTIIDSSDTEIDNAYTADPTAQNNWRVIAKQMRDIYTLCKK